jgi:hypothetical protein
VRAAGVIGFILIMGALSLSSGAEAAADQWKYLGTNDKGVRFFYDATSVIYMSKDLIQVWTRELTGEGPTKRLKEIDCSFKIIRDRQVIDEGRRKTPHQPPRLPSPWHAMEQDPVTKELYKALCR